MNAFDINPKDNTPAAIRQVLEQLDHFESKVQQRADSLREARQNALLDPQANIAEIEARRQTTELEIERCAALRDKYNRMLVTATTQVDRRMPEVNRLKTEAINAINKYRKAVLDYHAAAERIVEICQLEQAAQRAVAALDRSAEGIDVDLNLAWDGGTIGRLVVLPDSKGDGLLWGKIASSKPVSPYARANLIDIQS